MIDSFLTLICKSLRRPVLCVSVLMPLFFATYYLAYWLRFEGRIDAPTFELFILTAGWVVLVKLLIFAWCRLYYGWGRLVSFHDLVTLGRAVTIASLLIVLIDFIVLPHMSIPRSVVLLDWGAMVMVIGGLRATIRLMQDRGRLVYVSEGTTAVLIVGADDAGEVLLRALRRNPSLNYVVVGFIDNDPMTVGTRIDGIPVLGTLDETSQIANEYGVHEILITAGKLSGKQMRCLVEESREHSFHVQVLPSYEQLLGGSVDIRPRQVDIDDLLRRDPVQLDLESISQWIEGRTLLVTGSAGSIGSEICRQLLQLSPKKLVLVDRSENGQFFLERELQQWASDKGFEVCIADITDQSRMEAVFREYRPDIVFHAAAYKHVPLMEANAVEAAKNILLATRTLADLADQHQVASFVMISTDKAVNPTNVMGACKRLAEQYVQSLASHAQCRFVTVRFGNVLDSAGSVVPIFREQIARGGPITVTHPEVTRYFMTIPEASQLVIQAGAMGRGGEIFVLDMGEPIRIVDLAADMIRLSGLTVDEDIEIDFVGLRPGEKLYEELYDTREQHVGTPHNKIMVAVGDVRQTLSILAAIGRIESQLNGPNEAMVACLADVLPEYRRTSMSADSSRKAA